MLILLFGFSSSAFAGTCGQAFGVLQTTADGPTCVCGPLGRPIDPENARDAQACQAAKLNHFFGDVAHFGKIQNIECAQAHATCARSLLLDQVASDRKSDFAGYTGSAQDKCHQRPKDSTLYSQNSSQLDRFLAVSSNYGPGENPGNLSTCLSSSPQEDRNQAISKYYYFKNRIRNADLLAIKTYASINSLLGLPLMSGLSPAKCGDYLMKDRTDLCNFYATKGNCSPARGLDGVIRQTSDAMRLKEALEEKLQNLNPSMAISAATGDGAANDRILLKKEADTLRGQISEIESRFPWIKGKAFQASLSWYKNNNQDYYAEGAVRDSVTKQFKQNRDETIKRLDRYRQANSCIHNESDLVAKHCKNFTEIIDDTPEPSEDFLVNDPSPLAKNALALMRESNCSWDFNHKRDRSDEVVRDVAINVGITLATAGVGEVAEAAKLGRLATGVLDISLASGSVTNAYHGCEADLHQVGQFINKDHLSNKPSPFACPISGEGFVEKAPNVISDANACVLRTIGAAAGLLPMLRYVKPVNKIRPTFFEDLRAPKSEIGIQKSEVPNLQNTTHKTSAAITEAVSNTDPQILIANGESIPLSELEPFKNGTRNHTFVLKRRGQSVLIRMNKLQDYSEIDSEMNALKRAEKYKGERVYGKIEVDGKFGEAFEYIPGKTLEEIEHVSRAQCEEIKAIFDLAEGDGIFLTDATPRNIIIDDHGNVRLVDVEARTPKELIALSEEKAIDKLGVLSPMYAEDIRNSFSLRNATRLAYPEFIRKGGGNCAFLGSSF